MWVRPGLSVPCIFLLQKRWNVEMYNSATTKEECLYTLRRLKGNRSGENKAADVDGWLISLSMKDEVNIRQKDKVNWNELRRDLLKEAYAGEQFESCCWEREFAYSSFCDGRLLMTGATWRRSRGEAQQFGPAVSACNIISSQATKKVKAAAITAPG